MTEHWEKPNIEKMPVRNFHQVEPYLFRGGQPGKEGFHALKGIGIKTVVCLRWGKKVIAAEKASVESLGMTFISMPLNYWNLPKAETVENFLGLIDDADKHPVYVHCLHGSDRTGILLAIFRMFRQGWSFSRAYAEMVKFGFHRFRLQNFKWWLRKFTRDAGYH
jgi:protein tyrosine/serine phosphatase